MNSLPCRVLELYSGIGGMHCALEESGIPFEIVTAMDINTTANRIYRHNFPESKLMENGIETLTVKQLDKMKIGMILMSPPCQPFTRVGKKRDSDDIRTNSFLHLLNLLPRLQHCPSYILVENVKGFEVSQTRNILVETLMKCEFEIQEYLLTPLQFGIPNSRLRYYLIAKRKPLSFQFDSSPEIKEKLPDVANKWLKYKVFLEDKGSKIMPDEPCAERLKSHCSESDSTECLSYIKSKDKHIPSSKHSDEKDFIENTCVETDDQYKDSLNDLHDTSLKENAEKSGKKIKCDLCKDSVCLENYGHIMRQSDEHEMFPGCQRLNSFLQNQPPEFFKEYNLPDKDLKRFVIMDIVHPCLRKSICFTKRYGHFMEGAGSIVQMSTHSQDVLTASEFKVQAVEKKNREHWGDAEMSIIRSLQLRYFTPREIANLLCFPSTYNFPAEFSKIQLYRVLGNSLNVHVVSVLIRLLVWGDISTSMVESSNSHHLPTSCS